MVRLLQSFLLAIGLAACATPAPAPRAGPEAPLELLDPPARPLSALLGAGGPTLVVFATVWCEPCKREWPEVRAWVEADPARRVVYVVSGSDRARVEALAAERGLRRERVTVVVDEDGGLARAYDVHATPTLYEHGDAGRRGPFHAMAELE